MAAKRKKAPSKPGVTAREVGGVPAKIVERLRAICLQLPQAYEEPAWVGVRWAVRKRVFAHALVIRNGWPPSYARAAGEDGPLVVVTFRTSDLVHDALSSAGPAFFPCVWGTRWATKVVGMRLDERASWPQLKELIAESYRLLAPSKLVSDQRATAASTRVRARLSKLRG